jgi:hypothetical protein
MKTLTTGALFSLLLLLGCDSAKTTSPGSSLAVAGESGCYVVKFTAELAVTSDDPFFASGTVTGDLQGTVDMVFNEFDAFHGITIRVAADANWHITGGIIPELVGQTFVTRLTNRNLLLPTSIVQNVGSLRAISGVEKANVTYIGQTILTEDSQLPTLNFVGTICTE